VEGEQYAAKLHSGLEAWVIREETCFRKVAPTVLEEESHSMPRAPQDEVPRDSMPEAD